MLVGNKRGALELSVNTIVVVVIGITLLTLGLKWIYNIFGGLTTQQQDLQRLSEDKISEIFGGSDEAINAPTRTFRIEQGESYNLRITMRNILPETHSFQYKIESYQAPASVDKTKLNSQITYYKDKMELKSGEGFQDIIIFNSRSLPLDAYTFRIILTCIDSGCDEEWSVPIVMDVSSS
ncbi:MAG TPA: hypothetical protein VJB94_03990 [Candidatus Nanoarchaeia archaeon]|nr:hypothetical protein [Candidatus Nanoarchaeia archaeon]